jgi:hypothetical protein
MRELTTKVFRLRSRTVVHGRSSALLELSLALLQCLYLYHGAPHKRFKVIAACSETTGSQRQYRRTMSANEDCRDPVDSCTHEHTLA